MRLRIEELTLVNTSRTVRFEPGMNAIVGSMSGGKTATISCLRALLGAEVNVVPELRGRSISGTVLIGERRFRIIRQLVSTSTAKVDIAEIGGEQEVWRLPASQLQAGYDQTFRDWWLSIEASFIDSHLARAAGEMTTALTLLRRCPRTPRTRVRSVSISVRRTSSGGHRAVEGKDPDQLDSVRRAQ
ncbi:hypothetical protein ACFV2U_46780 [Streptomyces sp. NPDC059697]|uniref:hypothetical protein n=1 Tax=Streptomyces sp. NPDC059697 TaxID=3346912 RepID=UPI0036CDEF1E